MWELTEAQHNITKNMVPSPWPFFPLKFMKIKKTSFHVVDFEHEGKDTVPISIHVLSKIPLIHEDSVVREAQSKLVYLKRWQSYMLRSISFCVRYHSWCFSWLFWKKWGFCKAQFVLSPCLMADRFCPADPCVPTAAQQGYRQWERDKPLPWTSSIAQLQMPWKPQYAANWKDDPLRLWRLRCQLLLAFTWKLKTYFDRINKCVHQAFAWDLGLEQKEGWKGNHF